MENECRSFKNMCRIFKNQCRQQHAPTMENNAFEAQWPRYVSGVLVLESNVDISESSRRQDALHVKYYEELKALFSLV